MAEKAPREHPWRRRIAYAVLLGFLLIVALVILALPFRDVQGEGEAAKADLQRGAEALRAGDIRAATDYVDSARAHVDRAKGASHGIGGDVWQYVPVAGAGVSDVRHLVEALDDATAIAEIGVELYPQVLGEDASVVEGTNVDMDVLTEALAAGREAADHARSADAALREVSGEAPVVGDRAAAARDDAIEALEPVTGMLDRAEPMMDLLPELLGADDEAKYLVAFLNPAELRYSGGANTALATVHVDDGEAVFEDIGNLDAARANRQLYWKKVPGNPFHARGKTFIQNATWAPDWSVSGEEILRAWAKVTKEEYDGFIAIDVPAIASLVGLTGPIEVADVGTLDETNLTQTLVGSYDRFNDLEKRRALNRALIPIFRERLFAGGQFVEKFQTLGEAAQGRHFAVYFRDPDAQAVVRDLGVDGDLSTTDHDYLGVFSQNINVAKADFWLDRTVTSDVALRKDGSAEVELTISTANTAPPYIATGEGDPKTGYFTRWSHSALAVFLPKGVETASVTRPDGTTLEPFIGMAGERPYLYQNVWFPPQTTQVMTVRYVVPNAAEVRDDGMLVYRLDADPQGMVTEPKAAVRLKAPKGYHIAEVPAGWQANGSVAELPPTSLLDSPRWEVVVTPRGSASD